MNMRSVRVAIAVGLALFAAACTPPTEPVLPTVADLVGCYRATVPGVDDVQVINTGYVLGKYNVHPVTGPELCAGTSGGPGGSYYFVIASNEAAALDKCGAQFVNPVVTDFEPNYGPPLRYAWGCSSGGI